jgi:dTDP-4-dehydrorhamnose 3,5-epimerase
LGIDIEFVQDNQSFSQRGTLRGLHYQNPPYAQAKLIRVIQGEIMDVSLDLRKDSPTYGQHFTIRLSSENKKQLLVPQGFAHGFSVLSETAVVLYKCDQFYDSHHPAVLKMIQMVIDSAHKAGIWAGICGELGADLTLTETFVKMGIDELSVSPAMVLPVRDKILNA